MARRDPYDRNTDWFRESYYGQRTYSTRDPGDRDTREALKAYQDLHSKGNFYRTLAQVGLLASGAYLGGRILPRDSIRSALHYMGQVGRKSVSPFQAPAKQFVGDLLGTFPEHEGLSRAFANVTKTKYKNLELIDELEHVIGFENTLGPYGKFPSGVHGSKHGILSAGEIATHHIAKRYTRTHESLGRLRYATVGDVFDTSNLSKQIGERQFKVLSEARSRGLVQDHMVLDRSRLTGLYKDEFGQIVDSRWANPKGLANKAWRIGRSVQIPIIGFRPADFIANLVRPFTEGKFFAELGAGLPIGPGHKLASSGRHFGIAGKIFSEMPGGRGRFTQVPTSRSYKFFGTEDGGQLLAQSFEARIGEHMLQGVEASTGAGGARGLYESLQDKLGIGSAFKTREHALQQFLIDPIKRKETLKGGGAYIPFREGATPGFGYIKRGQQRRTLVEQLSDWATGRHQGEPVMAQGSQAGPVRDQVAKLMGASEWGELEALFGKEAHGVILKPRGVQEFMKSGTIRPKDIAVPQKRYFAQLGRRYHTNARPGTPTAGLGSLHPYRRVPNHVTYTGVDEALGLSAHFQTIRLNDLMSFTMGAGFRPTAGKWGGLGNIGKIYGVYAGARIGAEAAAYGDYLAEEYTGISPWKTSLDAYAGLRTGLQHVREITGMTGAARYAEDLLPGSVESPLSHGARFLLPITRGMIGGGRSGAIAGAIAGTFAGWGDVTKSPSEVNRELSGDKLIPYRKARWWMMGRQPYEGGQIDFYGPSWIARQRSGYLNTDVLYGSRKEYYENVSWLPTPSNLFGAKYEGQKHLEKKHYYTRPYPYSSSGEPLRVGEELPGNASTEPDIPSMQLLGDSGGVPVSSAGRLGMAEMGRPQFSTQVEGTASKYLDRVTDLFGLTKFAAWDLPGFQDKLGKRSRPATADAMDSHSRHFYDDQLGGMMGLSEIYRRFVPDEKEIYHQNRVPNMMPDWLPGARSSFTRDKSYYLDYTTGDPYTKVKLGEARLPGGGYDRLHRLHSGTAGIYDPMDRFLILADVAPHSQAYLHYKTIVQGWAKAGVLDTYWQGKYDITTDQVAEKMKTYQFRPRRFSGLVDTDQTVEEINNRYNPAERAVGAAWEVLTHDVTPAVGKIVPLAGPLLGDKLMATRSPIETYQKWELYGEDYADWRNPWKGFIRPKFEELKASDPVTAAAGGAMMGVFGSNPLAKIFMGTAGAVGLGGSSMVRMFETGDLQGGYVPEYRQDEREMKEYLDNLAYVKAKSLETRAWDYGEKDLANFYSKQARKTVAGVNYSLPLQYFQNQARSALDRRERPYFDAFVNTKNPAAREKIMEMVPDYVKPLYAAAWSKMGDPKYSHQVRQLNFNNNENVANYFKKAPLPSGNWAGWHPSVPMSAIKVKAVDTATNSSSLDRHRFNLWGPQAETSYRDYPMLDVPVIDISQLHRASAERHAFTDMRHQSGADMQSNGWGGSLNVDRVGFHTINDNSREAMQQLGLYLR